MNERPDNARPEQAFCFDYLERNAKAIATLNDSIFYFAELGMQEFETAKLMSALLDETRARYPDMPGDDPWWLPAHLGGTAPTPQQAAEWDAADQLEQVQRREQS